jgi:hypothetical protein
MRFKNFRSNPLAGQFVWDRKLPELALLRKKVAAESPISPSWKGETNTRENGADSAGRDGQSIPADKQYLVVRSKPQLS